MDTQGLSPDTVSMVNTPLTSSQRDEDRFSRPPRPFEWFGTPQSTQGRIKGPICRGNTSRSVLKISPLRAWVETY